MIARALLSVSDKTGLVPFAKALAAKGIEILSTGGTAKALEAAGVKVTPVEAYTGSPEVMDGRVKTLHPRVHGGILMRGAVDQADLERLGGAPIDLVVVNLYPFEQTVAREGATAEEIIENIDIGGPAMVGARRRTTRAWRRVRSGRLRRGDRGDQGGRRGAGRDAERLAAKAFARTAAYDGAVAAYLSAEAGGYPLYQTLAFERAYALRYGENPHQTGAFYRDRGRPPRVAREGRVGGGGRQGALVQQPRRPRRGHRGGARV
jgi:phosphoribosylaminoimidazolecarboxamide formyltransferase/IMP cyclohydrolase